MPKGQVVQTKWPNEQGFQLFLDKLGWEWSGWSTTQKQEWGISLLEHLLHSVSTMWRKEHQRCSQRVQSETVDRASEHPSMQTLLGSPDAVILAILEQVYSGEWTLAPSVLPCRQQAECMRILCQELAKHLTRAGLHSETGAVRPSFRSQWHCCGCSTSQTQSPLSQTLGSNIGQETEGRYPNLVQGDKPILGKRVGQGGDKPPSTPNLAPVTFP